MIRVALPAGLVVLCCAVGCGGRPWVEGTVTLDSQPLSEGTVLFVKTEGGLVREGALIKDGAFKVSLPEGTYKVEINAQKVVGTQTAMNFGKVEVSEVRAEKIPEWYNTKTELTVQIKPGSNPVKFDLKSKR
jgi:hypothetical protein